MTMLETVREALKNHNFNDDEVGGLDELVAFAYYLGRHESARKICDAAQEIFSAQIERASNNRYKNVCTAAQGGITQIYSSDYSFGYGCFANDEVRLDLDR